MSHNDLPLAVLDSLADAVLDGSHIDDSSAPAVPITDDKGNLQGLAMRLWLYESGRDMRVTQQLLEDRTGLVVSMSQLRSWRDAGNWGEIFHSIHQKVVTESKLTIEGMSTVATVRAVRTLMELSEGKHGATAATMLKASMSILDRFGYPTLLRGEMLGSMNSGMTDSMSDLSDDELEAGWREFSVDDKAEEPHIEEDEHTRRMNYQSMHASLTTAYPPRTTT